MCLYVILYHYNYVPRVSDSFVLECDASGSGIGAVLSVERDGDRLLV